MSTRHFHGHSGGRESPVVMILRLVLWGMMAYWAFQFIWTLWRWALGLV